MRAFAIIVGVVFLACFTLDEWRQSRHEEVRRGD